jgi:hypothetical protein
MIRRIGKRVLTLDKGRLIADHQLLGSDPPLLPLLEDPAEDSGELPATAAGQPAGQTGESPREHPERDHPKGPEEPPAP